MIVAHQNLGLTLPNGGAIRAAVEASTSPAGTGGALFTNPKLNAMREAAVAGDWRKLFSIAPRGCVGPVGPTLSDGTRGQCADDPNMPIGSQAGSDAYYYWTGRNPLRKNLAINDLRKKKDAAGRVVDVPLTRAEIVDFHENFHLSRGDWFCEPATIQDYINKAIAGRPLWPMDFCAQTSSSRRRKILRKVGKIAAVAVVATGAVIFGKAIITKALAGAAKAGSPISGAAGATVGTAMKYAPGAADVINSAATVKAVVDGKQPPPPISLGDGTLTNFATTVGLQIAERELGRRLTAAEEALLIQQIEAQRRTLAQYEQPHAPVVNTGLRAELTDAQRTRADSATGENTFFKYAAIGVPLALFALRGA